jgi:hypothetical protein
MRPPADGFHREARPDLEGRRLPLTGDGVEEFDARGYR